MSWVATIRVSAVGCTIGGFLVCIAACNRPPASPVEGLAAAQVERISVGEADPATVALAPGDVETVLDALAHSTPFKTGKVASDIWVAIALRDGRVIKLRLGPDQFGPPRPGSDVVWRWQTRDDRAYVVARRAIERSRESPRRSPTRG